MKNNKIRILAAFITLCVLSFTLAFSSSVAIAGDEAFSVALSGEEFAILGEKYRVNVVVGEFTEEEFYHAIVDYQHRERRFGKTSEQVR